jgi:hypothetical protein
VGKGLERDIAGNVTHGDSNPEIVVQAPKLHYLRLWD